MSLKLIFYLAFLSVVRSVRASQFPGSLPSTVDSGLKELKFLGISGSSENVSTQINTAECAQNIIYGERAVLQYRRCINSCNTSIPCQSASLFC